MKLEFRDSRGAALVELAVTAPFFLLILMGAFELGRLAYYAIEVENAARTGATYGAVNVGNSTSPNIIQAAKDDAPNLTLAVTKGTGCVCETLTTSTGAETFNPSSGTAACTPAFFASCSSENSTSIDNPLGYVTVSTQATVNVLFHIPALPNSYTLHGYSQLRILQN